MEAMSSSIPFHASLIMTQRETMRFQVKLGLTLNEEPILQSY